MKNLLILAGDRGFDWKRTKGRALIDEYARGQDSRARFRFGAGRFRVGLDRDWETKPLSPASISRFFT